MPHTFSELWIPILLVIAVVIAEVRDKWRRRRKVQKIAHIIKYGS